MMWAFTATVFIINAIGLCLLQLGGTRLTPEISQDSNPHITNPMGQRYNSAFFKETSPFCMLLCLVGMTARTLGADAGEIVKTAVKIQCTTFLQKLQFSGDVEGLVNFWIWIGVASGIIGPVSIFFFVKKEMRTYLRRMLSPATTITPIQ